MMVSTRRVTAGSAGRARRTGTRGRTRLSEKADLIFRPFCRPPSRAFYSVRALSAGSTSSPREDPMDPQSVVVVSALVTGVVGVLLIYSGRNTKVEALLWWGAADLLIALGTAAPTVS